MRILSEALEQRQMMYDSGSTVRIPVFGFHQVLQTVPSDDDNQKNHISVANFQTFLTTMRNEGFTSISLQEFYRWSKASDKSSVPRLPHKPFVAIFDDGNTTDLTTAAPMMKATKSIDTYPEYNNQPFKGVVALRTGNQTKRSQGTLNDPQVATWGQEIQVIDSNGLYDWDFMNHTRNHSDLGAAFGGDTRSANTPQGIADEISQGVADLQTNLGYLDKWAGHKMGFIHPFDDATERSIRIAANYSDMVFCGPGRWHYGMLRLGIQRSESVFFRRRLGRHLSIVGRKHHGEVDVVPRGMVVFGLVADVVGPAGRQHEQVLVLIRRGDDRQTLLKRRPFRVLTQDRDEFRDDGRVLGLKHVVRHVGDVHVAELVPGIGPDRDGQDNNEQGEGTAHGQGVYD